MSGTIASSRLARLAQRSAEDRRATAEHCELCGEPIPHSHRHLLDLEARELLCACRPCSVLFDNQAVTYGQDVFSGADAYAAVSLQ